MTRSDLLGSTALESMEVLPPPPPPTPWPSATPDQILADVRMMAEAWTWEVSPVDPALLAIRQLFVPPPSALRAYL